MVMQNIEPLAQWPSLRVAVGDHLKQKPALDPQMLEELLGKMLPKHNVKLEDSDEWRLSIRAALTQSVLGSIGAKTSNTQGRMYDRTQEAMLELQQLQAKVLKLNDSAVTNAKTPSAVIRLLIQHLAKQATSGSLSAADQRWITDLPHRITAIEYLAANDLQETVMLQRVWLRMLRTVVVAKNAAKRSDADNVIDELNQKDRAVKDSLQQLRIGQRAVVKMWQVWNRPK